MEKPTDQAMTINKRIELLVRVGEILLANGAATYRVEETMRMLGRQLDLQDVQIFATPTGFTLQAAGRLGSDGGPQALLDTDHSVRPPARH